jgi:DNA-binding transcriptional LysR family regulator
MDLGRIKVFHTLVKVGSFTKAAKLLNISQPAVTHSLQLFEQSVKSRLINRSTRGFTLTPEGERVFELAEKIIQETDNFWKNFRDDDNEVEGDIRIITTPAVGENDLTYLLLPYINERPNLKIHILTSVDEFDTNHADVAVRTFIPNRPDLEQLPLVTYHVKLWASPEYLKKFGTPKSVADLDKHRLLAYGFNLFDVYHHSNSVDWMLQVGVNKEKLRTPFFSITSHQGLYNAASQGFGIIQLPIETIKLRDSKLVQVLPDLEEPTIEYRFICNKKIAKSKRMVHLYEYLVKRFQESLT